MESSGSPKRKALKTSGSASPSSITAPSADQIEFSLMSSIISGMTAFRKIFDSLVIPGDARFDGSKVLRQAIIIRAAEIVTFLLQDGRSDPQKFLVGDYDYAVAGVDFPQYYQFKDRSFTHIGFAVWKNDPALVNALLADNRVQVAAFNDEDPPIEDDEIHRPVDALVCERVCFILMQ